MILIGPFLIRPDWVYLVFTKVSFMSEPYKRPNNSDLLFMVLGFWGRVWVKERSEKERRLENPKGKSDFWRPEQNLEYITPTIFVKMWGLFSYARPFDEKLFFGGKLAFRSTCFISTEAEMLPIFFVKSRQCTIYKTRDCRPHNYVRYSPEVFLIFSSIFSVQRICDSTILLMN